MATRERALADRVAALEDLVTRFESLIGAGGERGVSLTEVVATLAARVDRLERRFETIGAEASSSSAVEALRRDVTIVQQSLDERASRQELEESSQAVESLAAEVKLVKLALLNGSTVLPDDGAKVKVPEPQSYGGARVSTEVENFLWDVEQYFEAAKIPAARQVPIAAMYLTGHAKLWWRQRCADEKAPKIESWEAMKKELKAQFLPTNAAWQAREALRELRQTGTVREYVKQFMALVLDLNDMSDEDKVFNFVAGLKPWAQQEMRRRGVKDLAQAVTECERLIDLGQDAAKGHAKRGGGGGVDKGKSIVGEKSTKGDGYGNMGHRERPGRGGCFGCGKLDHRVKDCRTKLNVIQAVRDREASDEDDAPARLSIVRIVE